MLTPQLGTLAREALVTVAVVYLREYGCRADRHEEEDDPNLECLMIRIHRSSCYPLDKTWCNPLWHATFEYST